MKLRILLLLLYACTYLQGQAPERYRFMNFGAKDGLTDKYVYNAVQDAKGYMWFGTATGLYRYDGHRFKKISSTADQPGRTITNTLQGLAKDQSDRLWLGSINTLQWFDPASNRFWTPDFSHKTVSLMVRGIIQGIVPAQKNGMWVCTHTQYFFRFNPGDSSFTHFNSYPPGATKAVINIVDNGQEIYAVHGEGLYCFAPSGQFLGTYHFPSKRITNGFFDKKQKRILITSDQNGVFSFDVKSKRIADLLGVESWKKHIFFNINTAPGGGYLLGAYPLHYFHPETKRFFTFPQNKEDHQLNVTKVVRIVHDREQNTWLCSHSGLAMIPFQNTQIETILLQDKSTGNINIEPEQVFASPGGGNLLITNTTSQGLLVYDLVAKTLRTVVNPVNTARKRIFGLITTLDSTIFLSDRQNLFKYHPKEKKMTLFPLNDQNGKPVLDVSRNVCDQDGRIYITSLNNGFYIWDYPGETAIHYNKGDIDKVNANDNVLSPCLIDSKNHCWFTSSNGVYRYNKKNNRYTHLNGAGHQQVPPMGTTFDVAEDKRGHFWIVTQASGIYEWYEENGMEQLLNYNSNNFIGLPGDFCWRIMQSPLDSTLWVSNVAGLLRIDPIGKRVLSIFGSQNGFLENDGGYNFNIVNNGLLAQLYFSRLHLIDLKTYRFNPHKPKVQFQSFKAMEKELLPLHQDLKTEIILDADQNFLQFEFSALVFGNSNRNQYAWMMEGFDEKWVYGGNENKVSYASLKPGKYVFKVKAANNDGLWGTTTSYRIKIRPPFYASAWFIAMCLSGFAALLWFWNRSRVLQARKEEQLQAQFQQQIAESELKALRAQMNPHFIFNSLNSIQKYILKNEHFEASQYLTKFSRLIRLILDHSNQNNILLSSELDLLRLYVEMESLRFDDKFNYHFQVDPSLNLETCEIPSMLIQPYVENAIWHGLLHKAEKGTLTLHFLKKEENWLEVTIEDDGIGRAKAAELRSKQVLQKKSYGTQITENRIAVINRIQNSNATCTIIDLMDATGKSAGTRVELLIPTSPLTA
jgi:ligand-binding sensor domain-containing protein/two-component sensor histidine kinase